jgi:hypothetical protein
MKTISALLLGAALVAGVAAPAAAQQTYSFGTNPQGSLAYGSGTAIAKLMNEKGGMLGRVRAGGGSSTIVPQMDRGQIDFGINNALEARFAYNGSGPFEGKPNKNLRIVGQIFPLYLAFGVPNDSPIKTLKDAKGKRIPCKFTSQIILAEVQDAMLASAGLTDNDFQCVPVSDYIKGQHLLPQGKVDIAMAAPTSGATKQDHAQLKSRGGLRLVPIEHSPEAIARIKKVFPEATATVVVDKKNPSQHGDTAMIEYPFLLTAGAHVDEDVVYRLVKLMAANKDLLKGAFGPFARFGAESMYQKHTTPYHPGAVKAYKELGLLK